MQTRRNGNATRYAGVLAALFCLGAEIFAQVPAPSQGRLELVQTLNAEAGKYAAARRAKVASITTREAALERQALVRSKLLQLVGGLPKRTPLNAKVLGVTNFDGFRVEKILFESQPDFYVTSLLYVPSDDQQKHAAVVIAPGHGASGKAGDARTAAALARNGFVVLSYDPIGQGERLQYLDPEHASKTLLSRPTGEHGEAGLQPVLIGDAAARYWAWDGIRAVDYVSQRPEVDPARIGAFGCSGGGSITSLTAALDQRVAATAVACYNTTFDALLGTTGPQDAEQSTPGTISEGLDFPDWIEVAAPRPYAAVATYSDMFPFAGARASVQEARRFYALFDASAAGVPDGASSSKELAIPAGPALNSDTVNHVSLSAPLQFITGPGGHGALSPILGDIIAFFVRNLQPGGEAKKLNLPVPLVPGAEPEIPPPAMQVTHTGQVSSSFPSAATVASLNRRRGEAMLAKKRTTLRGVALSAAVRQAIGARAQPGMVRFDAAQLHAKSGSITLPSPAGSAMRGQIAIPEPHGKHPAVLLLLPDDMDGASEIAKRNRQRFEELSRGGNVVLALTPRPSFAGSDDMKSPLLGPFICSASGRNWSATLCLACGPMMYWKQWTTWRSEPT